MAQITYRANLSAAIFPLTLSAAGRSVIIPGPDNNYDRRVDPEGEQKDAGIPQAIYLQNVVPTANGYQSVGYISKDSIDLGGADRYVYRVVNVNGTLFAFVIGLGSYDAVYTNDEIISGPWTVNTDWLTALAPPYTASGFYQNLSFASVRGTTYAFVDGGSTLATVLGTTVTDVTGSVTGITVSDIQSILASYNYLIAIKDDGSICWSSTTNALDFTPSLVSGAGSATPNAIRSQIVAAYESPEGFIIYTKDNAVAAVYTGNSRYPWKFKEISNSGGHEGENSVAAPVTSAYHLTFNSHGAVMQISSEGATKLAPEISTFIRTEGCTYDEYNSTTDVFTSTTNHIIPFKVHLLLNRYIVLQLVTIADQLPVCSLIYDILLRRYGRFVGDYKHIVASISRIFTVNESGVCLEISFNVQDENCVFNSVLALGKFQYVRARNICMDEVTIEGELPSTSLKLLSSSNGRNFDATDSPYLAEDTEDIKTYYVNTEAKNYAVVLKGGFTISTLELVFHPGAAR